MQKMYNYTGFCGIIIMAKLLKSIAKLVQISQSTVLIMEGFVLLVFPFKTAIKREKTGRKGSLITY